MANGVNKVILVGNLGDDPKVAYTQAKQAKATFSIATGESWQDQQGNKQERTEWHRVVAWGKLAELCKTYLTKGRQVYLEGKLTHRSWKDEEGTTRYITEIVARELTFLGSNPNANANPQYRNNGNGNGNGNGYPQQAAPQGQPNNYQIPDMPDSEVPF